MSCHLSHKLPWDPILALYITKASKPRSSYSESSFASFPASSMGHLEVFAREFVGILHEFRATDKSGDHEMALYDPKIWGECGMITDFGSPSHRRRAGYYESLLWGYLELNLLLLDPERVARLMIPKGRRLTFVLRVLIGGDGEEEAHPDHMTSHLRPAFPRLQQEPLTRETLQILRDHAAMLFRCMYSVSGENKLLHETTVVRLLVRYFQFDVPRNGT